MTRQEYDENHHRMMENAKDYDKLLEENRKLKEANKALSDGISAQCKLENERLQILNYFVNTWDWSIQCEQPQEVIDQLRFDYGVFGYGDIETRVFLECHKRDMEEKNNG
jgi:hypothetical protein